MDNILYIFIALIAGFTLPLQSGINAELRRNTNSPYLSGAINNTIGAIIMVILAFIFRKQFPMQLCLKRQRATGGCGWAAFSVPSLSPLA